MDIDTLVILCALLVLAVSALIEGKEIRKLRDEIKTKLTTSSTKEPDQQSRE